MTDRQAGRQTDRPAGDSVMTGSLTIITPCLNHCRLTSDLHNGVQANTDAASELLHKITLLYEVSWDIRPCQLLLSAWIPTTD